MRSATIVRICVLLISTQWILSAQNKLPRDSNGWTTFKPHADTRIVYVSSSSGDDTLGTYYLSSSAEVGTNPFLPANTVKPFKTIAAAYKAARNMQPDWILLRKDDIWYESLQSRNGLSDDAPFLVGSYGTGINRPLLKTADQPGISYCCKNFGNAAFVDLDFYAHTRNPLSNEYTGPSGASGFTFYCGEGYTGKGILIEGCRFRFYDNNVVQGPGRIEDIVIRRSVILDNYSTEAHSQGLYSSNASLTLEENIFDHNGWYKQQISSGANEKADGQATMFNHNTYFANCFGVTFRGNIFLRASSIGNKWTANSGEASARNITIDNNLYVEGEIGISMGGNESVPPYRFKGISIVNNVMLDIGSGQPTKRTLGWGLEVNDWDSGTVSNNYFLHKSNTSVDNVYAINIIGQTRNLKVINNTIYGLNTGSSLLCIDSGHSKNTITISDNAFHNVSSNGKAVKVTGSLSNYTFSGNHYFCEGNSKGWFSINNTVTTTESWIEQSKETSLTIEEMRYVDPDRTIATYMKHTGKESGFEGFIDEVRQQCKSNWRKEFTASEVNKWIRDGFSSGSTATFLSEYRPEQQLVAATESRLYMVFNLNGKLLGTFDLNQLEQNNRVRGLVLIKPLSEFGKSNSSITTIKVRE